MKMYLRNGYFNFFAILTAASLLFSGCSEEVQRSMKAVPTAFGQLNEIVVVMDDELWDSYVGDSLRYHYSSAYPLLPQPEPIFNLRHFTATQLLEDPLRKELRVYMLVGNLAEEDSPTAKMILKDIGQEKARAAKEDTKERNAAGRDKWAKGQLLVYQFAHSRDELVDVLKSNLAAVKKRINEFDSRKLEAHTYTNGINNQLINEVKNSMGVNLRVPSDYFMAINDGDVIWLRQETDKTSSNLLLKKIKYEDESQLTKDFLIALRDSIGKQYVSSTIPGTYMRVNGEDLPIIDQITKVNGNYAIEARGIWEIVNDFMGGAFISYLILNPNTNELLFIDGFLHAPGENKRDFMEQLNFIMQTVKFQ